MVELCRSRWQLEPNIRFVEITPDDLGCTPVEFQRERRVYADQNSATSIYVVVDGDVFLPRQSGIGRVVQLLEEHNDFAILSPLPYNCQINPWTPEDQRVVLTDEVMEHESVGMARFSVKGALTEWPAMDTQQRRYQGPRGVSPCYDRIHCDALHQKNWRVGYARQVRWWHLGEGYSTVWRHESPIGG